MNGCEAPHEKLAINISQDLSLHDFFGRPYVLPAGDHIFRVGFDGSKGLFATVQWKKTHYKVRVGDQDILTPLETPEVARRHGMSLENRGNSEQD
ncbi:MAG: hypothetical protein AAGC99_17780 [Pseudomonadota bacterium]